MQEWDEETNATFMSVEFETKLQPDTDVTC